MQLRVCKIPWDAQLKLSSLVFIAAAGLDFCWIWNGARLIAQKLTDIYMETERVTNTYNMLGNTNCR